MKLIAAALVLLAAVGCHSGPCRDLIVYHPSVIEAWSYSTYHECGKQCCKKDPKACYCSKSCPCWGKHTVQPDPSPAPQAKTVGVPLQMAPASPAPSARDGAEEGIRGGLEAGQSK